MPIDPLKLLSQPAPEYTSERLTYEIIYPLPTGDAFKTVNAAVFYAFSRIQPDQRVERDAVDGGVVYYFRFERGLYQLFLLHISPSIVSLRIHRCELLVDAMTYRNYAWQPRDPDSDEVYGLIALVGIVNEAITDSLRCAVKMDVMAIPPPPPASELHHVFTWQQIYHPDMPDKELAELIGVSHQTVRNARSRYQQTKRGGQRAGGAKVPRGKSQARSSRRG
jgi:hypothetical protein